MDVLPFKGPIIYSSFGSLKVTKVLEGLGALTHIQKNYFESWIEVKKHFVRVLDLDFVGFFFCLLKSCNVMRFADKAHPKGLSFHIHFSTFGVILFEKNW